MDKFKIMWGKLPAFVQQAFTKESFKHAVVCGTVVTLVKVYFGG